MGYKGSYGRIPRSKDPLEQEADRILAETLQSKRSNKAKDSDILSDSQLARRQRRETPFSDLSLRDKLRFGISTNQDEE